MARRQMDPPPQCTFDQIYQALQNMPSQLVIGLITTGGVPFEASASETLDGRKFINLPHNNRIYRGDWGLMNNSMGKDGQRIGQYARPLDKWCTGLDHNDDH